VLYADGDHAEADDRQRGAPQFVERAIQRAEDHHWVRHCHQPDTRLFAPQQPLAFLHSFQVAAGVIGGIGQQHEPDEEARQQKKQHIKLQERYEPDKYLHGYGCRNDNAGV